LRSRSLVCTGCGSLCDDIEVRTGDSGPVQIENACAKGAAHIQSSFNPERRPRSAVRGQECTLSEAVEEAKHLLLSSRNPLIFGLDSSTLSAQALAMELAQKIGGTIDSASSFSYGPLIKAILEGDLPACSLAEVKDKADLLVYWGADPPNTHPRHLSLHSYYAYTDYNPAGWYPRVTLACVEVRRTELSSMSKPVFRLKPGGDKAFTEAVIGEAKDESGMARTFSEMVGKSRFCVVFCGLGLVHGLGGDSRSFVRMVQILGESTRMAVIPMISEINMRGFCRLLHQKTGQVSSVNFKDGTAGGREHSFLERVRRRSADCIMIIGSDPFSALPHSVMSELTHSKIICLSPFGTPSTMAADVVVPTALPGVECGGSVQGMDGVEVALAELEKKEYPTEEAVLSQFLENT
jgi:formylmethanofuran dehydrogenase subunit B